MPLHSSFCNSYCHFLICFLYRILSGPKARSILLNGAVRKGERLVPPSALDLLMQSAFPAPSARVKVGSIMNAPLEIYLCSLL